MSVSFDWSKEQLVFKRSVTGFAKEHLNHDLIAKDRDGFFDRDAWRKCAEFGILGWPIAEEYGGSELDPLTMVLGLEALGYGCRDNGFVFVINNHVWSCALSIAHFGTAEQKQRFLPPMCRGELIGGQALTELESGSDAFTMQTTATPTEDGYLLNGKKSFITNAPIGDLFIVFTRTDHDVSASKGVTAFIVSTDMPGVEMTRTFEKTGLRTASMGELTFTNCHLPFDRRLGEEGGGYSVFQSTIDWERSFYFAAQIGVLARLLDGSVSYARKRSQFGQPIGRNQAISHRLADLKLRLELGRLLIYKVGWLKQQGRVAFLESTLAKLFISESVVEAARAGMQIRGARGYLIEHEVERELRDALAGTIYAGTSEIQRDIIAQLLGL